MYKHAYGALLGAACGDASGSTLEFYNGKITKTAAKHAMTMPGGGCLGVGPGQITDDTELALALAAGLFKFNPVDGFPKESVLKSYIKWYKSNPFDIGNTIRNAFGLQNNKDNIYSQANGALMRITPLSIWCCRLDINTPDIVNKIAEMARQDALLSHPSAECQDCNAIYCIAQYYLIHNIDPIPIIEKYVTTNVNQNVQKWFLIESKLPYSEIAKTVKINIGWVRHGFVLAFHFLRNKTSYEEAILQTLLCGGDTDTNACIVGALIGSLGSSGIPKYMKEPVLKFDCTAVTIDMPDGFKRPKEYSTCNLKKIVKRLF
jgi:ADP-ribosylglycohydrolase